MKFHDVTGHVREHTELSTAAFEPETLGPKLDQIRRYCGLPLAFTVAEHSVLAAYLAREDNQPRQIQAMCLTHDLSDTFLGDVNGVHKTDAQREIERDMDQILVSRGWLLATSDRDHRIVKMYDVRAQAEERRKIWPLVYGEERYSARPKSGWLAWVRYTEAYQP